MTSLLIGSLVRSTRICPLPCIIHRHLCPVASSLFVLPGNRRIDSGHTSGHFSRRLSSCHKWRQAILENQWTRIGRRQLSENRTRNRGRTGVEGSRNVSIAKEGSSKTFLSSVPSDSESVLRSLVPKAIVPYAQLMRLDKPTGILLLLWPSYWSILLATPGGEIPTLSTLSLFAAGAVIMRGAGCTINDLWDKKYDAQVSRTKNRPLASGQISTLSALFFLAGQLATSLFILTRFDESSIILGACSMILVITYPLAKRYTHWAQLILGMTFNWGALLGYSVVKGGIDYACATDFYAVIPLYLAGISWTLIYDTIYAHQDKTDDQLIGLKSTAIKFGDNTKAWLSLFSLSMVSSLLASGISTGQTWPYYASVGLISGHLIRQIKTLNIHDAEDCWKKFKANSSVGFILASGLFLSTLFKEKEEKKAG